MAATDIKSTPLFQLMQLGMLHIVAGCLGASEETNTQ